MTVEISTFWINIVKGKAKKKILSQISIVTDQTQETTYASEEDKGLHQYLNSLVFLGSTCIPSSDKICKGKQLTSIKLTFAKLIKQLTILNNLKHNF